MKKITTSIFVLSFMVFSVGKVIAAAPGVNAPVNSLQRAQHSITPLPSTSNGDVEAITQGIMMQTSKDSDAEMKGIMQETKDNNAKKKALRDALKKKKDHKDNLSEMGEEQQMKLQNAMDRRKKAEEALSNAAKKTKETEESIIKNMK